jgi:chlorobactene glucosyltransferase
VISSFLLGPCIVIVAVVMLVVLALNLVALRRRPSQDAPWGEDRPWVSVLIPARNESACIVECVRRVLAQSEVGFEVIVLDDCSEDDTYALASGISDPRLAVLSGERLPDGWTGKNWACHQLAQHATGDLLCFVDADTLLEATALRDAIDALGADRADLVSYLVAAQYQTAPQAILLPMVNHALLALFPVGIMHSRWFPRIALALGPFMLVRADTYKAIGGHAAHPGEVVDDVRLCRAIKANGGRVRLANGTAVAETRWYPDTRGIWNGFSKNAFGALESSNMLATATVLLLVPLLTIPFFRLAVGLVHGGVPGVVLAQVALLLTGRLVTSVVGRDPLWTVPLHPLALVFWGSTLANSALQSSRGGTIQWRGREVAMTRRGTAVRW